MSKNEFVCCELCGRDTANKSGICSKCYGPGHAGEEQKGRKSLRWSHFGDSPLDFVEGEEGIYFPTASEEYHGPSIRDDL